MTYETDDAGEHRRLQGDGGQLLQGQETRGYGDLAYRGQKEVICAKAPKAKDFTNRQCKWKHCLDEAIQAKNRNKSRIRARVEHSIGVIKRVFGFTKVRYRGLYKNTVRALTMFALSNLYLARRLLMARQERCAP